MSVIVPVHNRSLQLRALLAALSRQSFPHDTFEVLVCDDGSSEDLTRVLSPADGLQLVYLRQRQCGPGEARNLGLRHARGEIVAFTDSDCVPDEHWLRSLSEALESQAVGLVGGRIDYRGGQFLWGRCLNFLMSSTLGAAGARDPRGRIHMKFFPRAGNLAVRRSLAEAVDGFSGARYGEDIEFSDRVHKLGVEVRFVPEAVVLHNEQRGICQILREAFQKGRTRVRLARLRRMHEPLHAMPAGFVIYSFASLGLGLLWPAHAAWFSIPGVLYALLIGILAVQGVWVLRDLRAALVVPLCALAIHFGYGIGYLTEWMWSRAPTSVRSTEQPQTAHDS
ncbi:MAG: glycosyltransferase [Isosphaeraceae bacterium]|nr:glycosyltransferase [Isosphaeraceae bacterium]